MEQAFVPKGRSFKVSTRQQRVVPLNLFLKRQDRDMVPNVPLPSKQPVPLESQNLKPWTVAIQVEDAERKKKIQLLSQAFGKKPGPYLTQVILDWIDTIDIEQLRQEQLPIAEAS
ncbi:hypothetical protein [Paenarthrobacter sp. NPDC058040]|uniref:hypothetical protein n=1 Tax=unclassified Paenarthrobacter TaxID=2634190 RepID=UPI0036DF8B9A